MRIDTRLDDDESERLQNFDDTVGFQKDKEYTMYIRTVIALPSSGRSP